MHRVARSMVMGLLIAASSFVGQSASATPSPCTGLGSASSSVAFDGLYADHGGQVLKKNKGYIEAYDPYRQENSVAWLMLYNNTGGLYGYAQTGMGVMAGSPTPNSPVVFIQIQDIDPTGDFDHQYFSAVSPGSGDNYGTYEVHTDRVGTWDFYFPGTPGTYHIADAGTDFDFAPNTNEVFGEVHRQPANASPPWPLTGDQMMGDDNEWLGFHEIKVYINGAWVFEDFYVGGYTPATTDRQWFFRQEYQYETGKSKEFDIRDDRCPN